MHLDDMWLSTDLWVNRHREDEGIVLFICKLELFEPQFLQLVGTHKTML